MFTAQDVLNIAIQLENNGKKTYRDASQHASNKELKDLLAWMAQEENNHARWFTELRDRLSHSEDHHLMAEMSRALVEDVVKGQAFSLEEMDFAAIDTPNKMICTFIGFEDDTIAFYEILKTFIDDPTIVNQLEQIIAEEEKHIAKFRNLLAEIHDPDNASATI